MRAYVDSSAYLAVLVNEPQAPEVMRRLGDLQPVSSVLMVLETHRTLVRLARERRISAEQLLQAKDRLHEDQGRMLFRDVTLDLCLDPAMPAVTTPRSLDLVHLRTAMWFHRQQPLAAYVTLDDVQQRAARELGLPA